MRLYSFVPPYLTDEQRQVMMEIPTDLSDRDLARYYTLISEELELVNRRRRPANRFGFAVQLVLLHFPGRPKEGHTHQAILISFILRTSQPASTSLAAAGSLVWVVLVLPPRPRRPPAAEAAPPHIARRRPVPQPVRDGFG